MCDESKGEVKRHESPEATDKCVAKNEDAAKEEAVWAVTSGDSQEYILNAREKGVYIENLWPRTFCSKFIIYQLQLEVLSL